MGERIIKVCDSCGLDLPDGTGASLRMAFADLSRGRLRADLCDKCAGLIPGKRVKARRRRTASAN